MQNLLLKFFRQCHWLLALILSACTTTSSLPLNSQQQTAASYNVQLGIGYLQQGNMQRAKAKLLLALQQAPTWPPALNAMGYFLEKTGESQQAQHYYLRSLKIAPYNGNVLNNYGTYLCRQKDYVQAERYFLAAIKDPDYLSTAEAYENAGLCALDMPNIVKAQHYFTKALWQDPQRITSLYELANIAFKQQQYSETLQYIDRYLNLAKGNAKILHLGYQASMKNQDKAMAARYAALLRHHYANFSEIKALNRDN